MRREAEERQAAEEKARLEEEEKRDAEEVKRREEEKARKKQKEKERIDQLKKEGKFMTKAQKEEKARNERKLQQMLAAGIKIGPQDGEGEDKKKKVVYDNRKRGKGGKVRKMQIFWTCWETKCNTNRTLGRRREGFGRSCRAS